MAEEDDVGDLIDVDRANLVAWLNPLNKPLRHKLGLASLVVLALLPVGLTSSEALMFSSAFFIGMFAMSWDAVSGYTGQISFGHSLFFAIGGYGSAILNLEMGLSPLAAIPVAMALAAVAGVIIGVPALRLRGPYLSLVTLIAPIILLGVFKVFSDVTGGEQGPGSPENLFGLAFTDAIPAYYIAFALFVFVLTILLAVTRSDAGRIFTAIRESEDAVNSAGLNPAKFKIFAFVLSAAIGGLVGAFWVHMPHISGPTASDLLVLSVNIEIIIAVIIGGMGTIVGAAVGGIFFFIAQELLGGVLSSDISLLLFALISLVIVYALPGGLLRGAILGGRKVRNRGDDDVATDGGEMVNPVAQVFDKYSGFLGGDDDDER